MKMEAYLVFLWPNCRVDEPSTDLSSFCATFLPSSSLSLFLSAHFTRELAFRFRTIPGRSGNPSSLSFQMFLPPDKVSDHIFCIVRTILMHDRPVSTKLIRNEIRYYFSMKDYSDFHDCVSKKKKRIKKITRSL